MSIIPFVQAPKAALLTFVERASQCAAQKTTMVVLALTALQLDGSTLHGSSTDIDNSFSTTLEIETSGGDFKILVNGKALRDRIDAMPTGDVRLEMVPGYSKLRISSVGSSRRFELIGVDFGEAKAIPPPPTSGRVQILAADLRRLLGSVKHAVSTDVTRVVSAALFGWKGGKLLSAGTDGHRLMVSSTGSTQDRSPFPNALIQLESIANLLRVLEWAEKAELGGVVVEVAITNALIHVVTKIGTYSAKLRDGDFPPYEQLLGTEKARGRIQTVVGRADMINAIKAVSVAASDKTGVVVVVGGGALKLEASSPEAGDATDEIACDYVGEPVRVCLQQKYALDLLETLNTKEVLINIGSPLDAVIITPHSTTSLPMDHTALIMPMNK